MPPKHDSKVKKRVRKTITMEVKSKILKLKDRGCSTSAIGRELNLSRTTVQTILKDREKLVKALPSVSLNSTIIRKRNVLICEMEKLLYSWIQNQTQRRVPLSLAIIQNKALSIFNTLQNKRGENNNEETKSFSASRGWFMRFKTRYSLRNIGVQREAVSADQGAAQNFPGKLRKKEDYSPKQILNVDEDLFELKAVKEEPIETQDIASVGNSKRRLTLKKLSTAIASLENAMKIFEENDHNFKRKFTVNNNIRAAYQCYQDLYNKKNKAKQSGIHSFLS